MDAPKNIVRHAKRPPPAENMNELQVAPNSKRHARGQGNHENGPWQKQHANDGLSGRGCNVPGKARSPNSRPERREEVAGKKNDHREVNRPGMIEIHGATVLKNVEQRRAE